MPVSIPETVFPYIRHRAISRTVKAYDRRIYQEDWRQSLHVIGLINIQFIAMGEEVYVIEVNPRSSQNRAVHQQSNRNPDR